MQLVQTDSQLDTPSDFVRAPSPHGATPPWRARLRPAVHLDVVRITTSRVILASQSPRGGTAQQRTFDGLARPSTKHRDHRVCTHRLRCSAPDQSLSPVCSSRRRPPWLPPAAHAEWQCFETDCELAAWPQAGKVSALINDKGGDLECGAASWNLCEGIQRYGCMAAALPADAEMLRKIQVANVGAG